MFTGEDEFKKEEYSWGLRNKIVLNRISLRRYTMIIKNNNRVKVLILTFLFSFFVILSSNCACDADWSADISLAGTNWLIHRLQELDKLKNGSKDSRPLRRKILDCFSCTRSHEIDDVVARFSIKKSRTDSVRGAKQGHKIRGELKKRYVSMNRGGETASFFNKEEKVNLEQWWARNHQDSRFNFSKRIERKR